MFCRSGEVLPSSALIPCLAAQEAQEDDVRQWVLRVELEAGALEVLHDVLVAVAASLSELFADGKAIDEHAAVRVPIVEERAAQVMPGLFEVHVRAVVYRRGGRVERVELAAKQAYLHLIGCAFVFGVQLKAGTLEVLHDVRLAVCCAYLGQRRGDGVAELGEAAVFLPVRLHLLADAIAGL